MVIIIRIIFLHLCADESWKTRWQSLARPWKTLYSTRSGFAWKALDAVQILSLSSVVYLYQPLAECCL